MSISISNRAWKFSRDFICKEDIERNDRDPHLKSYAEYTTSQPDSVLERP